MNSHDFDFDTTLYLYDMTYPFQRCYRRVKEDEIYAVVDAIIRKKGERYVKKLLKDSS